LIVGWPESSRRSFSRVRIQSLSPVYFREFSSISILYAAMVTVFALLAQARDSQRRQQSTTNLERQMTWHRSNQWSLRNRRNLLCDLCRDHLFSSSAGIAMAIGLYGIRRAYVGAFLSTVRKRSASPCQRMEATLKRSSWSPAFLSLASVDRSRRLPTTGPALPNRTEEVRPLHLVTIQTQGRASLVILHKLDNS
jgi:hypothetical protein